MNTFLRPMQEQHLDQVVQIELATFSRPWSRQSFLDELKNQFARYLVGITAKGQVAGYGGMWLIFEDAQITNVAVSPDMRGNNVGKLLLLGLIQEASLYGCRKISLEVAVSNVTARSLYESYGFVVGGLRKKYYDHNGEDALIMQLAIER